ncbi:hypothetical protein ACFL2V_21560, partial [Pseudomonadota bacterium]
TNSNIVLFETVTTPEHKELVDSKHLEVINTLLADHTETYNSHINAIKNKIAGAELTLDKLSAASDIEPSVLNIQLSQLQREIASHKHQLASTTNSTLLSKTQAMKEANNSIPLFSAIGLMLGIMAGIFLAFFIEFLNKVAIAKKELQRA